MEFIGHKIRRLRVERGLSIGQLEVKSSVDKATIGRIERRGETEPRKVNLIKFAEAFKLTYEQLIAGTNLETPGAEQKPEETYEDLLERARLAAPLRVPVYSNFPIHAGEEHSTPSEYFYLPRGTAAGENIEAYVVHGHCLTPKVEEGDIVIVDRDVAVDHGHLIICLIDGEIYVGRYEKRGEENWLQNNDESKRIRDCSFCRPIIGIYKRP